MTYPTLGKVIEIIIKSTFILNSKLPWGSIFIQFFLVAVKLMGFALKSETSSDFALNLQVFQGKEWRQGV